MQKRIDKIEELLESHQKHLEIANSEMGVIKNDVGWLKTLIEKLDLRVWAILSLTILGFLTTIAVRIFFK